MSSGWSRNVKTAAAAYLAYKTLGGARHVLYTGYGYDGDDFEWNDSFGYSGIVFGDTVEACFSCESINDNNPACERADLSALITDVPIQICPLGNMCGTIFGQLPNDDYIFQRRCLPSALYTQLMGTDSPCDPESRWGPEADLYCNYCDNNLCNGWRITQLPDESLANSGAVLSPSSMLFFLLLVLFK